METIRRMKELNIRPERTIHLTSVPGKEVCLNLKVYQIFIYVIPWFKKSKDEEIGGINGMVKFIETKEFKELNIGLALDEGQVSPNDDYSVYYTQRMPWC